MHNPLVPGSNPGEPSSTTILMELYMTNRSEFKGLHGKFATYYDNNGIKKLCVIVKDEHDGGVYRGHCDIWLGEIESDTTPLTYSILRDKLTPLDTPLSSQIF